MEIKFILYLGDLIGLPTSENHYNFRWLEPNCKVLFSACRQGNAASCHFAADTRGVWKIKRAINEFCEFIFWVFDWCEMIIAKVKSEKIERILIRCEFKKLVEGKINIYIRSRP